MITEKLQKLTLNMRIFLYIRKLTRESELPASQIHNIQFNRLKSLLCDAYNRHSFYRERFQSCGFDPFHMTHLDEIKIIPLLKKEDYRSFVEDYCREHPRVCDSWYRDATTGSTGTPLPVFRTWNERAYMCAKWMRVLKLNGYSWRDITFSLPSPRRLQRDSVVQRFGLFRRYTVPYTAAAKEMVDGYLSTHPTVIYSNKSQLVMMALYCQEEEITLPKPRLCVSAGETMDENSRSLITHAFGEEAFVQAYGAVEFNNLAWQEKGEDVFKFSHTTNLLETLDDKMHDSPSGRCVITDFFIRSFPLIRYDIGDVADTEIHDGLTVIKRIKGRLDDWFIFANGERYPFLAFYDIMLSYPELRQFRIIQESYECIRIQIVKQSHTDVTHIEKRLLEQLRTGIRKNGIEYLIDWVDSIPPDKNGKLRMLISKVKNPALPGIKT